MARDPKRTVADGYDVIADAYASWGLRAEDPVKRRFAQLAIDSAEAGSPALDLGCGTGEHVTRVLAGHFDVTAVDISPHSIDLARERVPGPNYVVGDMATIEFPDASFAVITAFYSLIHLPREEHAPMLARIASWLIPGGRLVATMGASTEDGYSDDWLGAPMYWSHFDAETNVALVESAGLIVESDELVVADEDGDPFTHQWIVAQLP